MLGLQSKVSVEFSHPYIVPWLVRLRIGHVLMVLGEHHGRAHRTVAHSDPGSPACRQSHWDVLTGPGLT